MRTRDKERLFRLFLAAQAAGRRDEAEALVGARFSVLVGGGPRSFSAAALDRLWQGLLALPAAAVSGNPALLRIVCVPGDGGAYRGGRTRSPFGPGTIEISVPRPGASHRGYAVPLDRFLATLHHEIGHAVAVQLGLYDTLYEQVPHSPWVFQGDRQAFLRRLLGDEPQRLRLGRRYLAQAPSRRSLRRALQEQRQEDRRRGRPQTPWSALAVPAVAQLGHNSRFALPCFYRLRPSSDGNFYVYDSGYERGFVLRAQDLARTRVSIYQGRSPNEWFAELFAMYGAGGGPPGRILRRRGGALRDIANWLDEQVGIAP